MKLPAGIDKWGSGVLGLVCVFLLYNLATKYHNMQPGKSVVHAVLPSGPRTEEAKGSSHTTSDLAQYDPAVHFDALKALDSRPLPDEDRNPFDFVGGAPPPEQQQPPAPPPPPPPAPPPIPLKAMGYNELPGGKKEAIVTYNDDVQMVHEGDIIGSRFKVVKITPTALLVEDGDTHQNLELPFPP